MWPRGVRKEALACDMWVKTISPSDDLRKLLHDNPSGNWNDFKVAYGQQLQASAEFRQFVADIRQQSPSAVTLLYAFRDTLHNHALVLQSLLQQQL